MATHYVSPGGALLRCSRLFSIPRPLPKPAIDLKTSGIFNSDTATLPYPTRLAITTPPSSLSRGDWGLKRPLPLRSTAQTSTPHIRVESIDTWEHVTEFSSAANHTLTLQKWQEINLPLSTPGDPTNTFYLSAHRAKGAGVFEEDTSGSSAEKNPHRWKFKGPWLAGQNPMEFNEYIRNEVRRRKPEFHRFLREVKAREDTEVAQREAERRQENAPVIKPDDITDEQLKQYIRELRYDRPTLFRLIRQFFDLPPLSPKVEAIQNFVESSSTLDSRMHTINNRDLSEPSSPYAITGPPKTHPSAGLSYLRTNSKIYNHPIYGPQSQPPPVLGRVIKPKNSIGAFFAKLGVAGVVADAPRTLDNYRGKWGGRLSHPGLLNIEPDKIGGSKIWLRPTLASIDTQGRIDLKLAEETSIAVAIHEGAPNDSLSTRKPTVQQPQPFAKPPKTTLGGYGLEASGFLGDVRYTSTGTANNTLAKAVYRKLMASESEGNSF
jgi:Mitochondrial ribosomal protein subunit